MSVTTYKDPVLVWRNEFSPDMTWIDPPPVPFTVTRSEVVIHPESGTATVHIWCAAKTAEPASRRRPDLPPMSAPPSGRIVQT